MLKYRTRVNHLHYNDTPKIEAVEIIKETYSHVYLPHGVREKKRTTEWNNYFDSREQAKGFVKDSALQKIRARKRDIDNMQKDIIKLENIIKAIDDE